MYTKKLNADFATYNKFTVLENKQTIRLYISFQCFLLQENSKGKGDKWLARSWKGGDLKELGQLGEAVSEQ